MSEPPKSDGPTITLEDIKPTTVASETRDLTTRVEEEDYDRQRLKAELKSYRQDTKQRKRYAGKIFMLICCWLVAVLLLLVFQGVGWLHLADSVLITAITGTTLNVIGIFLVVANYLFPKR